MAGVVEQQDIVEQVKTLSLKSEHVKSSIFQAIHKEYSELFPSTTQLELMKSAKSLFKEIQKLEGKFESEIQPNITCAKSQHKHLVAEYDELQCTTTLLKSLCDCNHEFTLYKSCSPEKFVDRAKHLQEIKGFLDSLSPNNSQCDIKIFKVLRKEHINHHTKTLNDIFELWNSLVVWTSSTSASWNSVDGHLKTSLKINAMPDGTSMVALIQAMDILHVCDEKLKSFAHKLYTYLIKPLAKFIVLVPTVQKSKESSDVLSILKKVEHYKLPKAKSHVSVYEKILEVITFIRSSLFHEIYSGEQVIGVDPMLVLGSFMWDEMSDMLINDHLSSEVPSTKSQMEKYEPIYEETVQFEAALIQGGFVPAGTNKLSKYVSDVNTQFSNKICQDILSEAHDILLYDIHNLIEVDPIVDRAAISPEEEGKELSKLVKSIFCNRDDIEEGFLQTLIFAFPVCRISDHVQKLMDFIYVNMVKATESSYPIASQIYHCCRDIFELFVNVVPVYHREALKLPQLAAVYYNNCMYLAHHCTTLGHQFRCSLPEEFKGAISTFADYVPVLRKSGTDCFLTQLQMQQQELNTMLEACNNFTECTSKQGHLKIERTFNQIIHHLIRLSKQWRNVLPANIFDMSIAILFNTVLENILASVFRMEDISAEGAGQLHVAFGILAKRIPEISLDSPKDIALGETSIYDHIRSWLKFNNLIELLDSSLLEISNMWDGGEGELAACMNEGEVRGLIRALFQNTDQRSKVLSKIKHKAEGS